MDYALQGKRALVTGAAGDIGSTLVRELHAQGCQVAAGDLDSDSMSGLNELGDKVIALPLDVTREESVQHAVQTAHDHFGGLDIVVNVAGVLCRKSFFETTQQDFADSLAVNVTGPFLVSKAAARLMKDQGQGVIINISSISGSRAIENRTAYGSSKAALDLLTQSAALELGAHGIRVVAVAPGVVDSRMARVRLNTAQLRAEFARNIPLQRLATPYDIAQVVMFLASPAASYITGETVSVDGGPLTRQSLPRPTK